MTLKSKLFKAIKEVKESLTKKFKEIVGSDWTIAYQESGKTFKKFQRDLLIMFHPDKHKGCKEATEITQTINSWEEPLVITQELINKLYQQRYNRWASKGDITNNPLNDKYHMMCEVQEILTHMGLTYDFTNETWYKEYKTQMEEQRVENTAWLAYL